LRHEHFLLKHQTYIYRVTGKYAADEQKIDSTH